MRRFRRPPALRTGSISRFSTSALLHTHKSSDGEAFSISKPKPYYVTTPIFYVNAAPHVGHLFSGVLADTFARYSQLKDPGRGVKFCTGTDEHGLKIQRAAESQELAPRDLCDKISQRFQRLAEVASLSHTRFIRTTEQEHYRAVATLWKDLVARGHIYKGKHEGWYSVSDEAFYAENQVEDMTLNGVPCKVSTETGSQVEWMAEETYKFRLSSFRTKLIRWLDENPNAIVPPGIMREVYDRLALKNSDGDYVHPLEDLSVSRPRSRLSWGVPVPDDPDQTIYVWIDALTNYLTAIGYPDQPEWKASPTWPADVQVIGKDIVRFHAIYWPAMLMAINLPPPKVLLTHAHWTMGKRKMSKSLGNVADPFQAIEKYGAEPVRYFLMRNAAIATDRDWSDEEVMRRFETDLQAQIGNLLQRLRSPKIASRLPVEYYYHVDDNGLKISLDPGSSHLYPHSELNAPVRDLLWKRGETSTALEIYKTRMDKFDVAGAMRVTADVMAQANSLYSELQPWRNSDEKTLLEAHVYAHEALHLVALLLEPVIPTSASRLLDELDVLPEKRTWSYAESCFNSAQKRTGPGFQVRCVPRAQKMKPFFTLPQKPNTS